MALLTAGYWPTAYWAESYYADNFWPDYGTAAAEEEEFGGAQFIKKPFSYIMEEEELLIFMRAFLEVIS